MNVLYYDDETISVEHIFEIANCLKSAGIDAIIMPKSTDLLLDCDIDVLTKVKNDIENAILEIRRKDRL